MAETDNATFCIMVDELVGKQEVVIKSLGLFFATFPALPEERFLATGVWVDSGSADAFCRNS